MNSESWLIHQRLAEDHIERLGIVNVQPRHILLFGADNDISRRLLAERYPKATFSEFDHRADFLTAAAQSRNTGLWQKLRGQSVSQTCQSSDVALPQACADWLWCNLGVPADAEWPKIAENWAHALQNDGLLFFTHFGRDTLSNLLNLLNENGIPASLPFADMHDIGDILFHHGFYDPVMDTATLQLEYHNPAVFWQDMNLLGLWQAIDCDDKTNAKTLIDSQLASGSLTSIALHIVYGHAVRRAALAAGEHKITFRR